MAQDEKFAKPVEDHVHEQHTWITDWSVALTVATAPSRNGRNEDNQLKS